MASRLKFFIIGEFGEGLCLAWRLQNEGHAVELYSKSPTARFVGRGLVPLATRPEPPRGACVVFTDTTFAPLGRDLRRRGFGVFGGNNLELVEIDRAKGARLMKDSGLRVPETYSFVKVRDAQRFLATQSGAWFFKPDDAPSGMTRNAKSSDAMIRWLTYVEPQLKSPKFELQRKVEGTEVDVDVWCDGSRIVGPNDIDIEEKKFLVGELGPRTGCQSNLVFSTTDPIVEHTIAPFYDSLLASGYCGLFSVNTIVTRSGDVYGLEFTARLGFDATQAWMALIPAYLGEQLTDFCAGNLTEWEMSPGRPFALTLHLSIPPYPLDEETALAKIRGVPLDDDVLDDESFHPYDVMRGRDGLACAGADGSLGVFVEVGSSLPLLRAALLRRAARYDIPAAQWRTDVCASAETRLDALRELGWILRNPTYKPNAIDFRDELRLVSSNGSMTHRDDSDDTAHAEQDIAAGFLNDAHGGTAGFGEDVAPASGGVDSSSPTGAASSTGGSSSTAP